MSKRTPGLPRNPRDFYPTTATGPARALAKHLPPGTTFHEPCAGDGCLARALEGEGMRCRGMTDIFPRDPAVDIRDALALGIGDLDEADYWISNPPWDVRLLHPLIEHLVPIQTTWFLLYTDWLFTKQAAQYQKWIAHVITMPRVIWIPDTTSTGFDNVCWVMFDADWGDVDPYEFFLSGW